MSSSRLIFLFLGIILLVIVILSSKRIATTLRGWFGKYIPIIQTADFSTTISPTPSIIIMPSPTTTPKKTITTQQSTPSSQIPATGPEAVMWLMLSGGISSGLALRKWGKVTSQKKS